MTDTAAPESSTSPPPDAKIGVGDLVEAAGHPVGGGVIKPGYDPRLTNEDLAPLGKQSWGSYNIFAFWMSDVHSVGGYVTAGSLFALGLASWQVLVALLIGITIVLLLLQPGRQAQPADRGALPGHLPHRVRRARRQHPGHHPRPHRGRVVRHPDLSRVGGTGHRADQAVSRASRRTRTSTDYGFAGLSAARLVQLPDCCGCCRRVCSGAAWSRSASSSTSAGPPSTSSCSCCAAT